MALHRAELLLLYHVCLFMALHSYFGIEEYIQIHVALILMQKQSLLRIGPPSFSCTLYSDSTPHQSKQ